MSTPLPTNSLSVVMMGATGAVGTETLKKLLQMPELQQLSLLGRREISNLPASLVQQYQIDIFEPDSYQKHLRGHQFAICTLGVGQPSKISKEEFLRIDQQAVLDFAKACKAAGVKHFSLLSSVGIDAHSSSFFLRAKGELVEGIIALEFESFNIFQPSMILTPENRYGILQGITLAVWPLLRPLLFGSLRKYRGIPVSILGEAMATNLLVSPKKVHYLTWDDFYHLTGKQ
ncbi:MAG: NAD(P)H-binding protein [Saprospiraceae bacterium]